MPESKTIFHKDIILLCGTYITHVGLLNLQNSRSEDIYIASIFKIKKDHQKTLRKSDLNCLLCSQKFVKMSRNDENLSVFPFSDIYSIVLVQSQFLSEIFKGDNIQMKIKIRQANGEVINELTNSNNRHSLFESKNTGNQTEMKNKESEIKSIIVTKKKSSQEIKNEFIDEGIEKEIAENFPEANIESKSDLSAHDIAFNDIKDSLLS